MSKLDLKIKHAGKSYDVTVDLDAPGLAFKQQIHQLTGVEPAKVKVVVKGGMLKDDADLKKLGLKAGQTIMVIGAAGALPPPPAPIVFMEDMTDTELAQAVAYPVGLQNLGNTCYMNSTVQVLRAIPELQDALNSFKDNRPNGQNDAGLTASLRDLYTNMSKTAEDFPPIVFLQMLRQFAPQFAERSSSTGQFSQQDAQEAWGSIVQAVKNNLKADQGGFVEQYMMGEFEKTLKSDEAPDEGASTSTEPFLELKCNITAQTNYMMAGITEQALTNDLEKTSPSLGREAVYHQTSRISRLPSYLTVNLVRFYWRRDINKKTKIMRKVKFPFDLDVLDLLTDDLKKRIQPVNEKFKDIDKDRRERAKIRRRAKIVKEEKAAEAGPAPPVQANPEDDPPEAMLVDEPAGPKEGELVDEPSKRKEEVEVLQGLLDAGLKNDVGANVTGLYELAGIVTHKGASADGGHYVGWCASNANGEIEDPDKQEWFKFDDDKVSTVPREKISMLEGGGEDHCAYILLYRSKKLE
ncbi:hypothetical protein BCR35DRAFT_307467 [Leucosporidium creatinivorum]|uniref:Ubiquitin carboxyl-terminal hydrolase n=1 Tax=Leucosporidium creatinivorum TaxID=106004 RepID=A0A1Y2EMZ0_9BASI|nr:hypothetical protein BCR35DRAFT_307467 [Leucosporidium creatinivorum]